MATNKTLNPTGVTIAIPAMADKPDASVFSNCIDKEADAINTLNSNIPKIKSVYFNTSTADQTIKIVTNGIVALFIFGIYRDNGADKTREGYGLIKIYNNTPIFTRKVGLEGYTLAYNQSTDELSITIPGYCSGAVFVPVL